MRRAPAQLGPRPAAPNMPRDRRSRRRPCPRRALGEGRGSVLLRCAASSEAVDLGVANRTPRGALALRAPRCSAKQARRTARASPTSRSATAAAPCICANGRSRARRALRVPSRSGRRPQGAAALEVDVGEARARGAFGPARARRDGHGPTPTGVDGNGASRRRPRHGPRGGRVRRASTVERRASRLAAVADDARERTRRGGELGSTVAVRTTLTCRSTFERPHRDVGERAATAASPPATDGRSKY